MKTYDGNYQGQFGYVKSMRFEKPAGMEKSQWEDAFVEGGPEDLLEILAKAGPPWNVLSERLRMIDHKFEIRPSDPAGEVEIGKVHQGKPVEGRSQV